MKNTKIAMYFMFGRWIVSAVIRCRLAHFLSRNLLTLLDLMPYKLTIWDAGLILHIFIAHRDFFYSNFKVRTRDVTLCTF